VPVADPIKHAPGKREVAEAQPRGGARAVEVQPASYADKEVLRHLVEFFVYDYSEYMGWDVDEHGVFGYRYLDHYWTEPDRHPFFIRVDGHIAGFALVRSGTPHDMAEFFVMRRYRRAGVGTEAARIVFKRFPGDWEVRQLASNSAATSFWRLAIPVPTREEIREGRPVQHFTIEG
jgi:predicted acetyltransferase